MTMSFLMSNLPAKTTFSLSTTSCETAKDAECFARQKFIRVLQAWAVDRMAAKATTQPQVLAKKAA
jgi:hypothetical protein